MTNMRSNGSRGTKDAHTPDERLNELINRVQHTMVSVAHPKPAALPLIVAQHATNAKRTLYWMSAIIVHVFLMPRAGASEAKNSLIPPVPVEAILRRSLEYFANTISPYGGTPIPVWDIATRAYPASEKKYL
jgi:hypothetical protein